MFNRELERCSAARSGLASDRAVISEVLVIGILLALFTCGLHHGQMSGLALSGLGGGFCTQGSGGAANPYLGGSDQVEQSIAQLTCPLCSSFTAAVASHCAVSALDYLAGTSSLSAFVRSWPQPPPRYLWPSLNPRASPR